MKLFTSTIFALLASSASAFTNTPSAFTPRSGVAAVSSPSTLNMVADDAKVGLVTGASRGLGRAIAVDLGKQGQKVIVNYAGSEGAANETVEMVKANPSTIINKDKNSVCSFNNSVKNARSGLFVESIEKETIPIKPMKKTTGTIIKKDIIKLFLNVS